MAFPELLQKIKKLEIYESREDSEFFLEIVCKRSNLDPLAAVLEEYFGPPAKPTGREPKHEHKQLTEPFGGILSNQTLYYRMKEEAIDIAMLWPWQNGELITVKVIQFTSQPHQVKKSVWQKIRQTLLKS